MRDLVALLFLLILALNVFYAFTVDESDKWRITQSPNTGRCYEYYGDTEWFGIEWSMFPIPDEYCDEKGD